jgi:hypothetical protein
MVDFFSNVEVRALHAFQHLKITPEVPWLGRSIDFLPATAESQARDQFI